MQQTSAVLIPVYNPPENLGDYIDELQEAGFDTVILVDDGSESDHKQPFFRAEESGCIILHHKKNRGKGAALRTGLKYYRDVLQGQYDGVVTVHASGSCRVEDVLRMADALREEKANGTEKLVLGSRDLDSPNARVASRRGNRLSSWFIKWLFDIDLQDTLTGIRGIPDGKVSKCLIYGQNDYTYETAVLLGFEEEGFIEVRVDVPPANEESESHYRIFADTIRIYLLIFKKLMKFGAISIVAAVIDLILFWIFSTFVFTGKSFDLVYATLLARAFSATFNYFASRRYVFEKQGGKVSSLGQFLALTAAQCLLSAFAVHWLGKLFGSGVVGAKAVVDLLLFFVAYKIQDRFIFRD